jgi:two-component system cell cycle response regulator
VVRNPLHDRSLSRLAAWAAGGVVAAALAVVTLHALFGLGTPRYSYFIENWAYNFVTVSAGLAILGRSLVERRQRIAWGLIGLGVLGWATGDVYWTVHLGKLANPPFPSIDDAFYLAGYVLVLAGVIAYVRARVGSRSALIWTDVAMGAFCVAALGTSLLLDYVIANTAGSASEVAVAVAYPLFDVATLAVAIVAVVLTAWRPGRGLALVAAGLISMAFGDGMYTYASLAGSYSDADWYVFLWPLGATLIALGALQPEPKRRLRSADGGWNDFASPMVFALAILGLMMLQRQDVDQPVVVGLTAATLIVLLVRLTLTFVQNRRLVVELETDSLTGLFNRSKLLFDLDRFFASEERGPHLLAILDLDGFKSYNDAFGHPAGDRLLIRLGHQLAQAIRDRGRAYRMGGDEFALFIAGDGDDAHEAVRRATVALSERGEGFEVTCSAGSTVIPREAGSRPAAVQLADQRMYAEKDSRRPSAGVEAEAVLLNVVNQRTPELGKHGSAVSALAEAVGELLDLSPGELATLKRASELHDVGKVAIPDAILSKPGALDEEEWEFMKQHTILGERIVAAAPSLASVASLIRSSHERWDGSGYPDGLAGTEIPLAARIIFACDAFDAITSERPYSPKRSRAAARAELRAGAGTQFDPQVVRALERVLSPAAVEYTEAPQVVAQGALQRSATSRV